MSAEFHGVLYDVMVSMEHAAGGAVLRFLLKWLDANECKREFRHTELRVDCAKASERASRRSFRSAMDRYAGNGMPDDRRVSSCRSRPGFESFGVAERQQVRDIGFCSTLWQFC